MTSAISSNTNQKTQDQAELKVLTRISVLLFLLLFGTSSYIHQNYLAGLSSSRLDLLHAIVREGRVEIDTWHENTRDKAFFNEHYYEREICFNDVV